MNLSQKVWLTPLTPHEFYALIALQRETFKAYGLRHQIIKLSVGSLMPSPTTTKRLAERLAKKGWLQRDRGNRYEITPEGRERLQHECHRLRYTMRSVVQ